MLIDVHMHIGKLDRGEKRPLTPGAILKFMDRTGIARACLLAMDSPEHTDYTVSTDYVLQVCRRYPDRFIPFCNVDPRRPHVRELLADYRERGCVGYGEATANLDVDDLQLQTVYEVCGELGLPIIFDLMVDACNRDTTGLPRYQKMIATFQETVFIGHGPHFWANVAAGYDMRRDGMYPKGPVRRAGAVVQLLRKYSNAYADLSAMSGYNALTRDAEFGWRFLEEFQDKVLFGTDVCHWPPAAPQMDYLHRALAEKRISRAAYEKIGWKNAKRLLGLK